MAVLRINGLAKSFGIEKVFENVSFDIRSGERVGLVGANGAGKTTLLKCIMGAEDPDGGSVKAENGAVIGYLRQDFNYESATIREEMQEAWRDVLFYKEKMESLAQALETDHENEELVAQYGQAEARFEFFGGYDYESTTRKILTGLGFTDEDWDRDIHSFSGGQKVRINLAAAFVRHPDFLLLDEPTNHLDMEMLEWLEEYLRSYKGGILMISHDRYFLDAAATGIIDLENHRIRTFRDGYTRYLIAKESQDEAYEKAYEKQQEHIRETEEYIRKYKAGIKSKQARGRQSQLNRLERLEKPVQQARLHFHFPAAEESAEKVLDVLRGEAAYGNHVVFKELELHIKKGDRVGLIGPNGAGKTTLLKMILGERPSAGSLIRIGNNVKIGYYSQEQERLHPEMTVIDEVRNTFHFGEQEARNILGMFLFRGDDVFKTISLLSGGEKARLSLLCLFLERPNFLILDEPTNHLDIPTREIMEDALQAFGGTSLIVSHDRYFLDKVVTRTLELADGKITEYLGNYSYYKEKKKDLEAFEKDRNGETPEKLWESDVTEKVKEEKIKSPKKEISPVQVEKLDHIEMEIARLEATVKMYSTRMNTEPEHYLELSEAYEEAEEKLKTLYRKWDELAAHME